MSLDLTGTDLFCGAGGSSIGFEAAGGRLRMAANHWPLATETHASNFPNADHDCADVSQVDPRRYPRTDILLASPECRTHSKAGPKRHDPNLFDPNGDPAVERSRATMWDVPRFAEVHRYQAIVVENVMEILKWAPFGAWLQAMDSLGYQHEMLSLNSMIAPPTPQSRDRLYVVFWRHGNRRPDLRFGVPAWCPRCERCVDARQAWKRPERPWGKYRQQYLYRCETCQEVAWPYIVPALTAIDWSLPAGRIGDRKRPLAEATRRRIEIGLERFARPMLAQVAGHTFERPGYARIWPLEQPTPAMTGTLSHALVVPVHHGDRGPGARPVMIPWPTQTGRQEHALVVPLRTHGVARLADGTPLPTIVAGNQGVAVVPFIAEVVMLPFTIDYHGNGRATPVSCVGSGRSTRDRHALVEPGVEVDDCGFRMLEPHEIGRAMAFPDDYVVLGNKRDTVRQYGNAVTPPMMTRILDPVVGSLA